MTALETAPISSTSLVLDQPQQCRKLVTDLPGPLSRALHKRRNDALPAGLGSTLPVFVERAGGGVIVDVDGNHLIDLASGIAVTSVGASAPDVLSRMQEQVARFTHTRFLVTEYDGYVQVAEHLNRLTPDTHAKRTVLFSTGAKAVENAVKIACVATGRTDVVVFEHAFHGHSLLTMAMTSKEIPYKAGFGPFPGEVHRAPYAYPLRWPSGAGNCAIEAIEALDGLLQQVGADHVAAIVIEPLQGEGGFIVPAPGFLPAVAALAARHGIVLVVDEVQSGLGRTGDMFASDHEGIVPDLICTAKAIGGGIPLAADRSGRAHGRRPGRWSGRHICRQPPGVSRRLGRVRDARERRPARQSPPDRDRDPREAGDTGPRDRRHRAGPGPRGDDGHRAGQPRHPAACSTAG